MQVHVFPFLNKQNNATNKLYLKDSDPVKFIQKAENIIII